MLKNGLADEGYYWDIVSPYNIPLLVSKDGCQITPIDKVYKRLTNGSEDSVVSFYKLIDYILSGEC